MKTIQLLLLTLIVACEISAIAMTFIHKDALWFLCGSLAVIALNEFRKSIINDIKEDLKNKHIAK